MRLYDNRKYVSFKSEYLILKFRAEKNREIMSYN